MMKVVIFVMAANYSNGSIGYDFTFEINEFGEPRIATEVETLKNAVLFVLMTKPGQYPSLPHIGLNIQSLLYSFYDEIDESQLQSQIIEQCNALGMYFQNGSIIIKKVMYRGQPSLIIQIAGNEIYPIGYKKTNSGTNRAYLIGITLDEFNKMIFNVNTQIT